ncbi:MAG: glycosyltransferase [Hyphomicrobiales bacterium]
MSLNSLAEKPPRLSVLMPVFNCAAFLPKAIESVLCQSYTDFEFLIHDDGSTDNSFEILEMYAKKDLRIQVTSSENKGIAATLNHLIESSRGELLARFDADDVCLPERFDLQVKHIDSKSSLVLVGGAAIVIDECGRPIWVNRPPLSHDEIDENNISGINSIVHPATLMKGDVVRGIGGYDVSYTTSQDLDLWLRMAEVGEVENHSEALIMYRIHKGGISETKRDNQYAMCRRGCVAAWKRRGIEREFRYSHWRSDGSPESINAYYLDYGWRAWKHGFFKTWFHYALTSVRRAPLSGAAWKLLILGGLRNQRGIFKWKKSP